MSACSILAQEMWFVAKGRRHKTRALTRFAYSRDAKSNAANQTPPERIRQVVFDVVSSRYIAASLLRNDQKQFGGARHILARRPARPIVFVPTRRASLLFRRDRGRDFVRGLPKEIAIPPELLPLFLILQY